MKSVYAEVYTSTDVPVARPLAGGAVATTLASVLFVAAGYVINVTLGRALGPIDYGLFGVVIGLLTVVNSLQTAGIPQAVAKLTAEDIQRAGDLILTAGTVQMGASVAIAAFLFFGSEQLAAIFGDARLAAHFHVASVAPLTYAVFTLFWGSAGGRGLYVRQAIMLSLSGVAKAIFAVGLGLLMAVPGAILGYVIGPLIGSAAGQFSGLRRARLVSPRPIVVYSIPLVLLAVLSMALLHADLFMVKALSGGPADAGHYTAAQNISRLPYFLLTGLTAMILPAAARRRATPQSLSTLVEKALRFAVVITFPLVALLFGTADDVVVILYSDAYDAAAGAVRVLSPAMALFALSVLLAGILVGVGRPWAASKGMVVGLLIAVLVAAALVPIVGLAGGGLATLMGAASTGVLITLELWREYKIRIPWLSLGKTLAASGVVGGAALLLDGAVATVVGVPLLAAAYVGLLIAMREVTIVDWQSLTKTRGST